MHSDTHSHFNYNTSQQLDPSYVSITIIMVVFFKYTLRKILSKAKYMYSALSTLEGGGMVSKLSLPWQSSNSWCSWKSLVYTQNALHYFVRVTKFHSVVKVSDTKRTLCKVKFNCILYIVRQYHGFFGFMWFLLYKVSHVVQFLHALIILDKKAA